MDFVQIWFSVWSPDTRSRSTGQMSRSWRENVVWSPNQGHWCRICLMSEF